MNDSRRRLMWHGVCLLLLGLLTGLAGSHLPNVRMALSAHLEGVMNGILLIAVAGIWGEVRLPVKASKAAFGLLLYGAYSNWCVTTLAAVFGTGAMTPIAGAGRSAAPWQEALVSAGLVGVVLSTLTAAVLLLVGLRTGAKP